MPATVFAMTLGAAPRHEQVLAARDRGVIGYESEGLDGNFDRPLTLAFAQYVREEREQRRDRNQSDDHIEADFERFSHAVSSRNRNPRTRSAGRRLLHERMA